MLGGVDADVQVDLLSVGPVILWATVEMVEASMNPDDRANIAQQAEAAVARALRAEGFSVTNLNEFDGNCSFADLLARNGAHRALVQVKSTVTPTGKFSTPSDRARALRAISIELGCHAVYAFVQFIEDGLAIRRFEDMDAAGLAKMRWPSPFTDEETIIRFANAGKVVVLANQTEAACSGICRYHVTIDQFAIEANQLRCFLDNTVPARAGAITKPKFWWPAWTWPW